MRDPRIIAQSLDPRFTAKFKDGPNPYFALTYI